MTRTQEESRKDPSLELSEREFGPADTLISDF